MTNEQKPKAQLFREKWKNAELITGAHVFSTDASIAEALAYQGFEAVWIDGEHCAFDKEEILHHIMAVKSGGAASFVRIPWNDAIMVKPVLEMGPDGIIFPSVSTKEQAEQAVRACMYPPKGIRGFGPRRAQKYGMISKKEYLGQVEESFLRMIQIEHVEAVDHLEEILEVEGIDLVIVGPNDLSASIGHLEDTSHPEVLALYDRIENICKKRRKPFGVSIGPGNERVMKEWIERGVSFLSCGDEFSYLCMGSHNTLQYIKKAEEEVERTWLSQMKNTQ